jgi:chorismate mutase
MGLASSQSASDEPDTTVNKALEVSREKIDLLDKKLITILGERAKVVKEIGVYKAKNNIPALQMARFQQLVAKNIEEGKKHGLSALLITEVMDAIHRESLRIEEEVMKGK